MISKELAKAVIELGEVDKDDYTICISTKDYKQLLKEVKKTTIKFEPKDVKKYMGFNLMPISIVEYGDIYITKIKPDLIEEMLKQQLN
jgi:hypothetical protein